jgi:hypothetical protein
MDSLAVITRPANYFSPFGPLMEFAIPWCKLDSCIGQIIDMHMLPAEMVNRMVIFRKDSLRSIPMAIAFYRQNGILF